jgi:hypothetical protein
VERIVDSAVSAIADESRCYIGEGAAISFTNGIRLFPLAPQYSQRKMQTAGRAPDAPEITPEWQVTYETANARAELVGIFEKRDRADVRIVFTLTG